MMAPFHRYKPTVTDYKVKNMKSGILWDGRTKFHPDLREQYHRWYLPDDEEGAWAEKLDGIWRGLSEEQQREVKTWLARQEEHRKRHNMPLSGDGFDLTPEERGQLMFEGEYDLIVAEDEHNVVFLINGKEVTISTGVLLECDEEGRFWVARYDAEALGLLQ